MSNLYKFTPKFKLSLDLFCQNLMSLIDPMAATWAKDAVLIDLYW